MNENELYREKIITVFDQLKKTYKSDKLFEAYHKIIVPELYSSFQSDFFNLNKILITGPQAAGKSVLLYYVWEKLLNNKESDQLVFFVDLFNISFFYSTKQPTSLLELYIEEHYNLSLSELLNAKKELVFLIDNVEDCHAENLYSLLNAINYLTEHYQIKFIITCRSSRKFFFDQDFKELSLNKNTDTNLLSESFISIYNQLTHQKANSNIYNSNAESCKFVLYDLVKDNYKKHFMLEHFMPFLAYKMYLEDVLTINTTTLVRYINQACCHFYTIHYSTTFPYLKKELSSIDPQKLFQTNNTLNELINDFLDNNIFLVYSKDEGEVNDFKNSKLSIRFRHQYFKDFFVVSHILNSIKVSLAANEDLPKLLRYRKLSSQIRNLLGELSGETKLKPLYDDKKGWFIPDENQPSILLKVLHYAKGVFNDKYTGWSNWNLITTIIESRGELSGLNFNNLDLYSINLNKVICSRKFKDSYLSASFENAKIYKHNFFEILDFVPDKIEINHCKSLVFLYSSLKNKCTVVNYETRHIVKQFFYNLKERVFIPLGEEHFLEINNNGYLNCWEFNSRKLEYSIQTKIKKLICYKLDYKSNELFLIDKTGFFCYINLSFQKYSTFSNPSFSSISKMFKGINESEIYMVFDKGLLECWDYVNQEKKQVFLGHDCEITQLIQLDLERLVTLDIEGNIMVWEIESQKCINKLNLLDEKIIDISFFQSLNVLLVSFENGVVHFFDSQQFTFITQVKFKTAIKSANSIFQDNKIIFSNKDGLYTYSLSTHLLEEVLPFNLYSSVNYIRFHSSGKRIIACYKDNMIKEWFADEYTLKCIHSFKAHNKSVTDIDYHPSKPDQFISVSSDGKLKYWKLETGKNLETKVISDGILSIDINNEGLMLLSNKNNTIIEWDVQLQQQYSKIQLTDRANLIAKHPFNDRVLLLFGKNQIFEWDILTKTIWHSYEISSDKVLFLSYDRSGEIIIVGTSDGKILELDRENETLINEYFGYFHIEKSETQKTINGGAYSYLLDLFEKINLKKLVSFENRRAPYQIRSTFTAFAYSSLTRMVLTSSVDQYLHLWSAKSKEPIDATKDISGLIIQGCNFKNLNPTSEVLEYESQFLLSSHGGIVSEDDQDEWNEIMGILYPR
ncbi:P-loop NTPase fold protein [Chondrinema litorale]|uniref:P-loop NTPase fold protein n=1 Tax=Chondrinema litorale TaxID=2994555 RepID=UPI002543B919|nr:P-loop NTPase fold protein [Chondrinema litorale]UZR93996.1 P-loop NTPase fold protein [Chondrinema litorale]